MTIMKKIYVIMLLFILPFWLPKDGYSKCCSQGDGLNRNVVQSKSNAPETTMDVDPVIIARKNAEAKKDSIAKEVAKWIIYFREKNISMGAIVQAMELNNSEEISKKSIEAYETDIKIIKKTVDNQFQDRALLNDNQLNEQFVRFDLAYEAAMQKIAEWKKEKPKQQTWWEKYWMIVAGAGFLTCITGVPMAFQLAAKRKMKKMVKDQENKLRMQAERELRIKMLDDEKNIINIK